MNNKKQKSSELYTPVEILLVEDNPHDARLTIEALKENKMANFRHIHHVSDGEEAIKFLSKEAPYDDNETPDIVLLDLNLPKVDGKGVLKFIRSQPNLNHMPVIMLTTSTAEKDIMDAYDLHVNAYVAKPVEFDQFLKVIKQLESFWLTVVKLPPGN